MLTVGQREKKTTARPMEGQPDMVIVQRFPAAGLREISIKLDADDVTIKDSDEPDVVVKWEAEDEDAIQPNMVCENHKLTIDRNNPDVYVTTFFSVFKKEGGKVTVACRVAMRQITRSARRPAISSCTPSMWTGSRSTRRREACGSSLTRGIRAKEISVTSISGDATVARLRGRCIRDDGFGQAVCFLRREQGER